MTRSTALATASSSRQVARLDLAPHQIALIKKTVARDCTEPEFNLFMEVARMRGLNPFANQISPLVFSKDDEKKRNMVILTRIDGARAIAARLSNYRPMEGGAHFDYDETLKGPTNPLGIVRAEVKLWKFAHGAWHPVIGEAYWDEFAPVRDEAEGGYDWVETGEVWEDSGKAKKKKVARGEVRKALDTSGNWGRMPRQMIAKCAEMQALRRGWPEDYSGLYVDEEFDRAKTLDASEIVAEFEETERVKRVGGAETLTFLFDPGGDLEVVQRGAIADRLFCFARDAASKEAIEGFLQRNAHALRTFWAWEPGDALEFKKFAEQRIASIAEHGQ